jgi:hypothetical protein
MCHTQRMSVRKAMRASVLSEMQGSFGAKLKF